MEPRLMRLAVSAALFATLAVTVALAQGHRDIAAKDLRFAPDCAETLKAAQARH